MNVEIKDIFLKLMLSILKNYITCTMTYLFAWKHVRNLKQALNQGLVLKKVLRIIRFNQKAWLKSYIYMNTELRKTAKNDLKNLFSSWCNVVFGKTMGMWQNIERYQACNNGSKKELFSVRTKTIIKQFFFLIKLQQ